MLDGSIDIAVHSMKDMPVLQPDGLIIDCCLPREDVRDAFLTLDGRAFAELPKGTVVGTSSLRRKSQLLFRRPDLEIVEFRGNVQTRLKKLENGVATGTFLAMAGLRRLGLTELPATPIETEDMLPAVAQGAIGIERRQDDTRAAEMLAAISDAATVTRVTAERAFLQALDGSCQTPIAGLADLDGATVRLRGEILRTDGTEAVAGEREGAAEDGAAMGRDLAAELLERAGPGFLAHQ